MERNVHHLLHVGKAFASVIKAIQGTGICIVNVSMHLISTFMIWNITFNNILSYLFYANYSYICLLVYDLILPYLTGLIPLYRTQIAVCYIPINTLPKWLKG